MEEPGRLQSMGSLRVRRDWAISLSLFTFTQWRRQWQPTPVFLPGESQGRESLGGLPSVGSHRVGHDWSDLAAEAAAAAIWSTVRHVGKHVPLMPTYLVHNGILVGYFCDLAANISSSLTAMTHAQMFSYFKCIQFLINIWTSFFPC